MRISQAKAIVEASIDSQIQHVNGRDAQRPVPYLVGGAGLGKTSVVQAIANEREVGLNILSLAQYDAGELAGWLVADGDSMKRLRPDWMPADGEGILFLDELPQAPVANQNIAAQLVNERRIGEHRLPDGSCTMAWVAAPGPASCGRARRIARSCRAQHEHVPIVSAPSSMHLLVHRIL